MNMLKSYLQSRGIKQGEFAEAVGVQQATVSRLASGKLVPSLELAVAIERATNRAVLASSWVSATTSGGAA